MNMRQAVRRTALALCLAAGLTTFASAADYNFTGPDPPAYYQATGYETIYGSRYNYGGPNLTDFRFPELAYGLDTQPGIGMAEAVRLPAEIGYYKGGYDSSSGGVSYGYSTSGGTAASYGYGVSSEEASSYGLADSDTLYLPSTSSATGQAAALTADQILPASFFAVTGYTSQTSQAETAYTSAADMKRSDGSIGTVKIPSLGLTRKVWEGESTDNMAKGMAHFSSTSAWDGNVGLCGHNRGYTYAIGTIRNLKQGDTITYTTVYGTRTYSVVSVETIASTDWSRLQATADNRLTLTTCLANQPEKRVCVQAVEVT